MKKILFAIAVSLFVFACKTQQQSASNTKKQKETWIFIMAGQSNMAGRGNVEAQDTITSPRILTINKENNIIKAKEPIHFYEPNLKGVDCGLSFAKTLTQELNENITILLIPTAVGGSSSRQWLGDSVHRNVKLLSNFKEKVAFAKTQGTIKGILWHQGESDANPKAIPLYKDNLTKLFSVFREEVGNSKLPILIGELGAYSKTPIEWNAINEIIKQYITSDSNAYLISTNDLVHKGDFIHFDSQGQRLIGQRFAEAYLTKVK